jgi:hypothetical protein
MEDRIEYVISKPSDEDQKCFKIINKKDDLVGLVTVTDQKVFISLNDCELIPMKSSVRRKEIEY